MLNDMSPRRRETRTTYALAAWDSRRPGCGISFDCDAEGHILNPLALPDLALRNLCAMLFQPDRYTPTIETRKNSYPISGSGRCTCGCLIYLDDDMTNSCRCGRLYDGYGQELADPSQWGEETGERFDSWGREIL